MDAENKRGKNDEAHGRHLEIAFSGQQINTHTRKHFSVCKTLEERSTHTLYTTKNREQVRAHGETGCIIVMGRRGKGARGV